jgi:hypothetical protein
MHAWITETVYSEAPHGASGGASRKDWLHPFASLLRELPAPVPSELEAPASEGIKDSAVHVSVSIAEATRGEKGLRSDLGYVSVLIAATDPDRFPRAVFRDHSTVPFG